MTFNEEELVQIKSSPFGKGLFATKKLSAYTVICRITGSYLRFNDTLALAEKESYCLQTGIDEYILCISPFSFSNHSCTPNCAISANLNFYALQDIEAGEELLWDYSTSMYEKQWTMNCRCGSKECRHLIQDFDLLPQAIQENYIRMKIVLPFIVEEMSKKGNYSCTKMNLII